VFNRGAAINAAARQAPDADVYLIVDGDVVAEPEQIQAAVERADQTGRLTFAFTRYKALEKPMTDRVLGGYSGSWESGGRLTMTTHQSSVLAVTRKFFEVLDGFDERCEGWGQDDLIFAHCARVLGGGCERIDGTVWHLWHPVSAHRAKGDPHQRAANALAVRYFAAHDPTEIRRLIQDRHASRQRDAAVLVVVTDGRRECIERTVPAALANLKGLNVRRTIISDDSGDIEYAAWLRWKFDGVAEVVSSPKRSGYAKAVQRAWDLALGAGMPWVFWLEDDFVIDQPVDLAAMAEVMDANEHLTQIVLRRQPWFPPEVAAGGIIDMNPGAYTTRRDGGSVWEEHQLGHWTNPMLMRRTFLAAHTWPDGAGSEARFSRQVMTGTARSAFWGHRDDPPTVDHVGERRGTGY
jgi:glycosyltransferase involved in cell wall biosynthesis